MCRGIPPCIGNHFSLPNPPMMVDSIRIQFDVYGKKFNPSFFCDGTIKRKNGGTILTETNKEWIRKRTSSGIYTPRYHLETTNFGFKKQILVAELSLPKLLNGHNLIDINETDYPKIVEELIIFFLEIDIPMKPEDILSGIIAMVAIGKNIRFKNEEEAALIWNLIRMFTYRPRSKSSILIHEMQNEVKFFNDFTHVTVYNKTDEIKQNAKTLIEKEIKLALEGNVYTRPNIKYLAQPTIRIESTLHSKAAIKQRFSKYFPDSKHITFAHIINDTTCKSILKEETCKIFKKDIKVLAILACLDKANRRLIVEKYAKRFSQKTQLLYLIEELEMLGLERLRRNFISEFSRRTWYYRIKNLQCILQEIEKSIELQNIYKTDLVDSFFEWFDMLET